MCPLFTLTMTILRVYFVSTLSELLALSASLSTACPLRHAYSAPPPPEGEAFQGSPFGEAPAKRVRENAC